MKEEEIRNLSDDKFHKLAEAHSKKFPSLLNILTKEEIIYSFYSYYGREIKNSHDSDDEE